MTFFMITEGATQIEEIFIGTTKEEVIQNARSMINQWPEYKILEDDEVILLVDANDTEFDLVKIEGEWPGENASKEQLISIYNQQYGG